MSLHAVLLFVPICFALNMTFGPSNLLSMTNGARAGIGFAVPVDTVRRVVPQIIRFGEPRQVGLGIVPFNDSVTQRLRVQGVLIADVMDGGPADRAGLRGTRRTDRDKILLGDLITSIDGRQVSTVNELLNLFDQLEAGQMVDVTYVRNDQTNTVKARVEIVESD